MNNNVYAYSEIFDSIQGEGEYTGYPTAWLRFYLCNLQCNGFVQDDPTDPSTHKHPYKDYDIIVSNPPYLSQTQYVNLGEGIKKYEPKIALLGGKDGLNFYRLIANEIEKQTISELEPSNGLENFGLQEEGSFELFDNSKETQNHYRYRKIKTN